MNGLLRLAFHAYTVFMNSYKQTTKPGSARERASVRPALTSGRLLDQLRERIRYKHYSLRTEQQYVYWVRAFVRFNGLRHPREMGAPEVERFLSWLAAERKVAVSTHKQALAALLFLYREVFEVDLPWMTEFERPKTPARLPSVLSREEVARVLACMEGPVGDLAGLVYGTGMRLMEALRLEGNRGQTTVFLTLRNFPWKTGVCPRYPCARLEMPHGLARRLPDDWIAPNGAIGEWLLARAGSSTPGADREVEVRFRFIPLSGSFGPHEERQPFQRCRNAGLR